MLKKILAIVYYQFIQSDYQEKNVRFQNIKWETCGICVAIQVSKFNSVELNVEKSNIAKHIQ
jgi:hypothetical protein